ncbi:retrovirus-related Pol polyprotein from transposon 17.6 [Trichonephila clavipes]|nr:retrovirus-related Pol polyprotein from transposon 17.6 [Trichonephila clavipes]
MNPVMKEVLREQIEELLRQNVIEECGSPYATPVVLVPKPNGKLRLCVDYRKLNSKHLEDLEKVFERLSIFKLHANRDKCYFACDRVKYLGFWITKDGIEANQEKISAIQKTPVPTNVKEVQSLIQTCSWFRRYIPNFADIARPLSSLTKNEVQWHWGPEQQESFETLKMRLRTSPILKQADESKPFTIRTDASSYALGAVLLQGSGPDEHVIEYASRLMIPAERNYSTTEREALAVVWALEKF